MPTPVYKLPKDDSRWERGDWDFNPGNRINDATRDAPWEDPKILRRRIGTPEELAAVADAIVRGYEFQKQNPKSTANPFTIVEEDPDGNERVIVGTVGEPKPPDFPSHGLGEHVVVENLKALIEAVQAHPQVRLANVKTEVGQNGPKHVLRRWVEDREGNELPIGTEPTELRLWHSVVALACGEGERYEELDIVGLTLKLEARFDGNTDFRVAYFTGNTDFWNAHFAGKAEFDNAYFAGEAGFDLVRFAGNAWFYKTHFAGKANFRNARFAEEAMIQEVRFAKRVMFIGAHFAGAARFYETRFAGDAAIFYGTHFDGKAALDNTYFAGDADFTEARFAGDAEFIEARFDRIAQFWEASFAGDAGFWGATFARYAGFGGARFDTGCAIDGDLRRADVRKALCPAPSTPAQDDGDTSRWKRGLRAAARLCSNAIARARAGIVGVGWTTVRSIGELSVLTRVSVLALILVPPLASAWPAIRAGIVGYNGAVTDLSARFEAAAKELHAAAKAIEDAAVVPEAEQVTGERADALAETIGGVERSIDTWSDRFARMTMDDQNLPTSLALAFFAAAFITIAQLIYQSRVPTLLRKHDEDSFVEWTHTRYPEGKPDRNDGLRRACDNLAAAARLSKRRHANLITHHGETVWMPPKDRIEWFDDIKLDTKPETHGGDETAPADDTENGTDGPEEGHTRPAQTTPTYPKGYLPGAERSRIALEEGAKAEYWMASRKGLVWAWFCFVFYAIGLLGLLGILLLQGAHVLRAAGWGL